MRESLDESLRSHFTNLRVDSAGAHSPPFNNTAFIKASVTDKEKSIIYTSPHNILVTNCLEFFQPKMLTVLTFRFTLFESLSKIKKKLF